MKTLPKSKEILFDTMIKAEEFKNNDIRLHLQMISGYYGEQIEEAMIEHTKQVLDFLAEDIEYKEIVTAYQLCPKCNGEGFVQNTNRFLASFISRTCPICDGRKLIVFISTKTQAQQELVKSILKIKDQLE